LEGLVEDGKAETFRPESTGRGRPSTCYRAASALRTSREQNSVAASKAPDLRNDKDAEQKSASPIPAPEKTSLTTESESPVLMRSEQKSFEKDHVDTDDSHHGDFSSRQSFSPG